MTLLLLLIQAASTTASGSHSVGGLMSDLVHHAEDDLERRLRPIDSINSQQGLLEMGSDSSAGKHAFVLWVHVC